MSGAVRRAGIAAGAAAIAAVVVRWGVAAATSGLCRGWGDGIVSFNDARNVGLPELVAIPARPAHPFMPLALPWFNAWDAFATLATVAFACLGAIALGRRLAAAAGFGGRMPGWIAADTLGIAFACTLFGANYTSCRLDAIHRDLAAIAATYPDVFAPEGGPPSRDATVAKYVERKPVRLEDGYEGIELESPGGQATCNAFVVRPAPKEATLGWRPFTTLPAALRAMAMGRPDAPDASYGQISLRPFDQGRAATMLACGPLW